ncbi:MAG TPA: class I SAM-dependent methyltransferase [Bacteroidota bacterium]|nr:class I SAM-dependent methyltransferase [Bacteroidota bacterium]
MKKSLLVSPRAGYKLWAATYDDGFNPARDLDAVVVKKLFRNARLGMVLEFGCGTGKNTRVYARIARHLLALDSSAAMLEQATKNVRQTNIEFHRADIRKRWPAASGSIDLVACSLILEHVRNLDHVFNEVRRCLRPGGRLFISEFHPYKQLEGKKAKFETQGKTMLIQAFQHHVSEFLAAGKQSGLELTELHEWWHKKDKGRAPRLLTLMFTRKR